MTTRLGFHVPLVLAVLCSVPALASAQQQQFGETSPVNTYVTWGTNVPGPGIDVTYFISPRFTAQQANLIRSAAAAWSNSGAAVNLVEVNSAGANIAWDIFSTGNFLLGDFNRTSILQPTTYPNGTPWRALTGQTTLYLNSFFTFADGSPGTVDFEAFALDLFGFAIGLGNAAPGDTTSVMQPLASFPAGVGNHSLSPGDIVAVNAVYGTPEPATLALFGIGLAALGFSKKFRRLG